MIIEAQTKPITISLDSNLVDINLQTPIARDYVDTDPYTGEYTVVPSEESQVLYTTNLRMTDNLVVSPIPSNYGRILWNGSTLKVY